jgi:hypothetical protein
MQQKVKIPAIGLIVLGVIGVLACLYSLFAGAVDVNQLIEAGVPEAQAENAARILGGGGKVITVVCLAGALFVVWAGLQMKQLKSRGAAIAANILVMVPCVTSCCCIVGIPLGIWGLVVLFNADVKRAFEGGGAAAG